MARLLEDGDSRVQIDMLVRSLTSARAHSCTKNLVVRAEQKSGEIQAWVYVSGT